MQLKSRNGSTDSLKLEQISEMTTRISSQTVGRLHKKHSAKITT